MVRRVGILLLPHVLGVGGFADSALNYVLAPGKQVVDVACATDFYQGAWGDGGGGCRMCCQITLFKMLVLDRSTYLSARVG